MAVTAESRLETLQVYKLLQSVRKEDTLSISKLCTQGIPMLVNYRDPQDGECALHLAAQANNEAMTKLLLKFGAFPNVQDFKGRTPVMTAADYGHDKTVEILAKSGADLKIQDKEGKDVLFYCLSAATKRHKRCLDIVLAHGADVNNPTESGKSVLVTACESSTENEIMCMMLLEKGADPNAVNKLNGRSALSEACSSGSIATVRTLLQKGANPNIHDKKLHVPLHFASQMGALEAVKALAAYGANCDSTDTDGYNALHYAAEGGFAMICKYLGQRGCNPKAKNTDGFTPRLLAKEKSHKDAGKELRKAERVFTKYSKPGMKNPNDPAAVALYDWSQERVDVIREVLMNQVKSGEETEDLPGKGSYVDKQDFDIIMKKLGAPIPDDIRKRLHDVHDKDRKGLIEVEEFLSGKKYISKTYLMSAFEGKKKKGKKGKKGGKKGKKGRKFKMPMPICTDKEGPRRPDGGPPFKFVEKQVLWTDTNRFDRDKPPKHPLQDDSAWYLQQPEKLYMNITDAVKLGDMESLKRAFETGTDIDTRDKYFKTPLMAACAEGNLELTKYLLSRGASVEARDNFKWTPLHHACHSGQLDVVETLIHAGADGNAVTWNFATPLMRAIESCKPDVVKFLLDCGASVTMQNKKEKTALDVARDWGDGQIYQMVKEKFDAAPKPKKDKSGKRKPPGPPKPLTIPPIPQGHLTAPNSAEKIEPVQEVGEKQSEPQVMKIETTPAPVTPQGHDKPEIKSTNSILLAADELTSHAKAEEITFTPRKSWTKQSTTEDLLNAKQEKRTRFGYEVDFEDFEMPLKKNISNKVRDFQAQA
uniref:ankyrin repeat and EF-hand domain-containing protein 1 n=1 Tax=Ciona intestinalis TaxID=7719 RepID=UPI000180C436|nr:ankyrin repeat and EF-hand domain-containing protein 1 [Ciona intestinalis]|eukprot:XP_009858292.1 ankyrin repeat and EF-hand domain-containing protein 1 [Ciona intestinalis]